MLIYAKNRRKFMENVWYDFKHGFMERLRSLKGSPGSIAAGAATGVMVSFTPFIGLHTLLAIVFAWLIRANVLAAALGTVVGNPWTFPFIWASVYYTGRVLLEGTAAAVMPVNFENIFHAASHALMTFDFSDFLSDVWPVLKPMIIGCVPFCIAAWIISYYIVKNTLDKLTAN